MDDDIWGDITQSDPNQDIKLEQKTKQRINEKLSNIGYRDGLQSEEDKIDFEEFCKGFADGNLSINILKLEIYFHTT